SVEGFPGSLRLQHDACAVLYCADAREEEADAFELRFEGERFLRRQRHEEPARCLGVVRESEQLLRHTLARDVRAGELAVARIAARADACARRLERSVERRERGGAETDPDAAPVRRLVRVTEQAEAGDIGDRVRRER